MPDIVIALGNNQMIITERATFLSPKQKIEKKMAGWQKAQKQHHQNSPSSPQKKPLREIAPHA